VWLESAYLLRHLMDMTATTEATNTIESIAPSISNVKLLTTNAITLSMRMSIIQVTAHIIPHTQELGFG
jgi:hypothetical protein